MAPQAESAAPATPAEVLLEEYRCYLLAERGVQAEVAWIASGAVAALAISFSTAYTRAYLLSISVAAVAAVFWYLEAHWKVFQDAIGDRVRIIEAYFRSDPYILEKNPVPFQAYHQFSASYEKDLPIYREHNKLTDEKRNRSKIRRILAKACNPYVFMPYALIIVASMVDLVVLLITAR